MEDEKKTKEQLINALVELRQRITELEALETERKQAEEEIRRRSEELAALNAIAEAVSRSLDLGEVLHQALDKVLEITGFEAGGFGLVDEARELIVPIIHRGVPQDFLATFAQARAGDGLRWRSVKSGEAMFFENLPHDPRVRGREALIKGFRAGAYLSLKVKDKSIGFMALGTGHDHHFSPEEKSLLMTIANQIAVAIENAQMYEETKRRAEELAVLNEIGPAVSSVMRLDDLLELISRETSRVIDTSNLYIALYNTKKNEVSFPLFFEEGERRRPEKRPARRGMTEYVINSARPLMINRDLVSQLKELNIEPIGRLSKSWLGAPMLSEGGAIGVLAIQDYQKENAYDESHLRLLSTIASQTAIAIENARLYKQARQSATQLAEKARNLEAVYRVSSLAGSSLEMDHILSTVTEQMVRLLGVDHSGVLLFDPAHTCGRVAAEYPSTGATGEQFPVQGYLAAERIIAHPQPLLIEDTQSDPLMAPVRETMRRLDIHSMLILPLVVKGEVMGSIGLDAVGKPRRFSTEEIELAQTIANQVAIAIENARAYERLKNQSLETISALAAAMEAKDPYTSGHSEKVTQFAIAIAQKMRLSSDEREDLRVAGLLHDIGKIGIPDGVLNKPAQLTSAEFLMVKAHPVISAEIVGKIEALAHLVPDIRHHHEWYDGNGYPDGLKGEEIPLLARILAVADGFEAMTSERPYRMARTEEEALAELQKGVGSQWDPQMVEVFLKIYEEGALKHQGGSQ